MESCPFYTLENRLESFCIEQNYLYNKMIYCQYSIWPMVILLWIWTKKPSSVSNYKLCIKYRTTTRLSNLILILGFSVLFFLPLTSKWYPVWVKLDNLSFIPQNCVGLSLIGWLKYDILNDPNGMSFNRC